MQQRLGIDPAGATGVVIAAVGIYAAFIILVRLFGQRPLARMSAADMFLVLVIGAIAGRAVLNTSVSLTAGVIALGTLFVLHWLVEAVSRTRIGRTLLRDRPVLLMIEEDIQRDHLARFRVSEDEIWTVLRSAGVDDVGDVCCVVLEPTGTLSVLRKNADPLDRRLFADVVGRERMPERVFDDPA